ncbi:MULTISPECIES: hypothetical protein [unclassified Acidisoma]|jgi:hypothetical protein|uniref:hypothetical protein n=1 Tax=unclassified Acidisoma TaxID=2634065 RepID=UPI00131A6B77|nr:MULTISPECIES: hypothetical protein [unclassified Acidisoma]
MGLRDVIETVHQRARAHEATQASLSERRETETETYDDLFRRLDDWLKPLVAEGKIQTSREAVRVVDAKLGELKVCTLSVHPCPNVGVGVSITPTGAPSITIRNEIKMRRTDNASRPDPFFIYKLASDGEEGPWRITRRTHNPGKPKPLVLETFEEAICTLFLG